MCISISDGPPYRCCCCIPIIVGVLLIFVFDVLMLLPSISIRDWWGVAIYGTIAVLFLVSFFQRANIYVRKTLYYGYLVGFILTICLSIYILFIADSS